MTYLIRLLAGAALAATLATGQAFSHEIKAGDLLITNLWTRATPGGAKVAGGYITIENKGASADRLVSATSPSADRVELHEMSVVDGVMSMRPLAKGLAVEPGKTVTLAPGGLHLMFMDIKAPLKEGENLAVTLQFEKAGAVETKLHVRGIGAQTPANDAKASGDHQHGMKM